jgi:hypothetical protein
MSKINGDKARTNISIKKHNKMRAKMRALKSGPPTLAHRNQPSSHTCP